MWNPWRRARDLELQLRAEEARTATLIALIESAGSLVVLKRDLRAILGEPRVTRRKKDKARSNT
jgi:hypothetical protein